MIRITAEIREGALAHRATVTAPSIERARRRGLEDGARVRLARELQTFGRRYERRVDNFLGFMHLGA